MAHDLLLQIIRQLSYQVDKVSITHSKNRLYYATICLSCCDGVHASIELDARPSDAFALALAADAPIYVASDLVSKQTEAEGSAVLDMTPPEGFRAFLENVKASDFAQLGIRTDLPEEDELSS